ncbi:MULTISPECIES: carbon-nitrogen hydrolase family protein [Micromonospora]|uniref:carbon-nitrogen hydrolase family protein n=1 Tax=Micromonospora TaxID=1873 RepID=UPI0021A634E3|nr:carbon-nitrogen hydrolase family protein [Micromonospora chalcea]MCT2279573.1 carbon-nitrogen hydrolase family protein [Micromonospora chalcea]
MRIGACQTPEILGDTDEAVRVIRDYAIQAEAASVDLLLFPECFLQGYLVTEKHLHEQALELDSPGFGSVLSQLAGLRQMLVFGLIERAGGCFYNTAVVVTGDRLVGRYRKSFLFSGESLFTAGTSYPVFDCAGVRFGINICYDTQHPQAAAAVAAAGARVLLVPAQNMMRREKAFWWQDRHNEIRACRARETGMWLASADVTGERDGTHLGLGPSGFLTPTGEAAGQVPAGVPGMATVDICTAARLNNNDA